ncbi:Swt1 family HEPN domain-containing protein [Pseudalkalibacillus sp. Hm43]|uniref:Swt1 family HEPN domain-containing protein n=1 Tax=Pseudalkalibacillus sp. Hm43 TaxID=3450742 RepID=UPI003F42CB24
MNELNHMKEAYGFLYKIENTLRKYISKELQLVYGENWYEASYKFYLRRQPNKSFVNLQFHELISFFKSCRIFINSLPRSLFSNLYYLCPIRNKIAHCVVLDETEFKILRNTYNQLLETIQI